MVLVSLKKLTGTATEEEALISPPTFLLLPEVVLLFLTSYVSYVLPKLRSLLKKKKKKKLCLKVKIFEQCVRSEVYFTTQHTQVSIWCLKLEKGRRRI